MKEKAKLVLCRYISYYPPPSITLHPTFSLHDIKDIYRRYFLRNIQRDIFNLPLDILNIPIISLADYKEKIEIYTKYLEKKSNWAGRKYLWLHRWISQVQMKLVKISQVEFVILQLGGDFATWFTAAKTEFELAKWYTCACKWFRSCEIFAQLGAVVFKWP